MAALSARALAVLALLCLPAAAQGQAKAPNLSKEQRQALMATVTAVKNAADLPAADEGWQTHLLRASDGSHYLAFSVEAPAELAPDTPLILYVRLSPRPVEGAVSQIAVRSPVEEWLLGQRNDPLPLSARGVVQVPTGELPVGSAPGAATQESLMELMTKEKELVG